VGHDQLVVDHGSQVFPAQLFDLVDLVAGAKAVEKVDEGYPRLQCGGVGDEG